jgi:hypothetical protein
MHEWSWTDMSKQHGRRQQKQLAKQKAKRQARQRQIARDSSRNPAIRLKDADNWPVSGCFVPESLWELGIGNLLIARRMPDGHYACGIFLLDVFCLGVKNALWNIRDEQGFNSLRAELATRGRLNLVAPEYFAKLVYRAADYARAWGFAPHHDFRNVQRLLAGIDPSLCSEEFQFGSEGKPLYIRGPNESPERARVIATRIEARGGDFAIPLTSPEILQGLGEVLFDSSNASRNDAEPDVIDEATTARLPPWQ